MHEPAYAKINLALHVRERRPDGYHRIETLFAFAKDGDMLSVSEADRLQLSITGPFAGALTGDNLVLRAAEALRARFGVQAGAALLLDKRLPIASGIGGGSADAAAALRLLDRWWGLGASEADLLEIGASIGADVPACIGSRAVRGAGRGDELSEVDAADISGLPLLLVNPRVPVPTGAVFAAWDGVDRGPLPSGPLLEAAASGRNDLEPPAIGLAAVILEVIEELRALPSLLLARMSGSGATCFAIFREDAARNAASTHLAGRRPDWWQLSTRLR